MYETVWFVPAKDRGGAGLLLDRRSNSESIHTAAGYLDSKGPSASWPAYSDAIQTGFQEVMTSAKTPEKAVEDTQAAVDEVKASEK